MGKKTQFMLPVENMDLSSAKYEEETIQAPHLSGVALRVFVWLIELPHIGSLVTSFFKRKNGITRELQETLIPEAPMFRPEFPPQELEPGTFSMEEESAPITRVESAMKCLPPYNPANRSPPFLYWTIRDFAHAYLSGLSTPSVVAECIISELDEFNNKNPTMPFLISFHADDVRNQAAASTQRFQEGRPLSILDGIFMCVKDDIDCYPHPTKGATTWFHKVRPVKEDAVCVSRLRSCGVILLGKANMHELGLGVSGNNPNYGTARNPHALDRYTGGSSSGPAALVAAGLCSAAVGTDGGGSIRIPSSLCGIVGLKTTYGRTNMEGSLVDGGTMEIIGPLAATVEDVMLVSACSVSSLFTVYDRKPFLEVLVVLSILYAAMLGSSPADKFNLKPQPPPSLPMLSSGNSLDDLGSLRLGKYTEWFNDVYSTDISDKCDDVLNLLQKTYASQITEIVIPELHEMKTSHMVAIGSETLYSMNPYCLDESGKQCTHDTRASLAFFRSFSASDYVGAGCLRRRMMYYFMEIFKRVDVIVTPTTGVTAPVIPPKSFKYGETDYQVQDYLMRFVVAANLLGLPAISVPVGHDKQGLPIGIQLIGRPWAEATILRLAFIIEELTLESRKRPSTFYDVLKVN
ncbi:hypothetical protein Sjap_022538 [Stephania japonica]|uniref:Amidase domain-containing protein n=1 Tax=Stephania japonica TaxID=461633 RepID=A0AAP0EP33_9MAGN